MKLPNLRILLMLSLLIAFGTVGPAGQHLQMERLRLT